jgi:hypothetical protein
MGEFRRGKKHWGGRGADESVQAEHLSEEKHEEHMEVTALRWIVAVIVNARGAKVGANARKAP